MPAGIWGEGRQLGISESIDRSTSSSTATNGDGDALVSALLPSRAVPETDAPRQPATPEWEYRTELLEHGFMGFGKEQVDMQKLQDRLDALGQDGWELVHVSWNHRVRRKHGGHLLIFKRPKS
jgi:hypothetical protein